MPCYQHAGALHRQDGAALINDSSTAQKLCSVCGEIKPYSSFYVCSKTSTGRQSDCISCHEKRKKSPEFQARLAHRKAKYSSIHTDQFYEAASTAGARKICSACKQESHVDHFNKLKASKSGFNSWCKQCMKARINKGSEKNRYLKRTYGIDLAQYEAMLKKQNGGCAICGKKCTTGKSLAVDHCHKAGHVRGLLCGRCNRMIGLMEDDATIAENALNYLLRM